jgi:hypothetical protein
MPSDAEDKEENAEDGTDDEDGGSNVLLLAEADVQLAPKPSGVMGLRCKEAGSGGGSGKES